MTFFCECVLAAVGRGVSGRGMDPDAAHPLVQLPCSAPVTMEDAYGDGGARSEEHDGWWLLGDVDCRSGCLLQTLPWRWRSF